MKKGFFFSTDALLGTLVLVGGLMVVLSLVDYNSNVSDLEMKSEDVIVLLNAIKVIELDDPWVVASIADGSISDPNISVMEQIGYFWAAGDTADARTLAEVLLDDVHQDIGIRLYIENDKVFERNGTKGQADVLVDTQLISGIAQGQAIKGSSASAYLRRIEDKRDFILIPFGGFVGEGNLSYTTDIIPADANITNISVEADTERIFDFKINGVLCDQLTPLGIRLEPTFWNLSSCVSLINPGVTNTFDLDFTGTLNGSFVAGGFVKIEYTTDDFAAQTIDENLAYQFPYIEGVVNLYDGFYVDGNISSMNVTLHFLSNYTSYLTIGNASWQFPGSVIEQTHFLNESTIAAEFQTVGLTLADISSVTAPIRYGIGSVVITGSPSDTVMVTDTSGSMDWCISEDIPCDPGELTRLEGAINATVSFIEFLLNSSQTLVGLVEFASSVKSFENLTNNESLLTTQVNAYTAGGATCICCGVNKAVTVLSNDSQVILIPRKTSGWLYNDSDLPSPPTNWTNLTYDDSGWTPGTAEMGYGWGYSPFTFVGNQYIGDYYYRRKFNVTNATDIQYAGLYVKSDDGADVYLNDVLIDNDYPNSHFAVNWNRADIGIPTNLFVEGENILSVRQYRDDAWWLNRLMFDLEIVANYNLTVDVRTKNMVVMTDGEANRQCAEQGTGTDTGDAIQAACDAYNNWGIIVYTVGFGIDADETTLQAMAACGNGEYFSAQNVTDLTAVFGTIADAIIDRSTTQRSIIEGNPTQTILYGNSTVRANYTPVVSPSQPNEISISLQSDPLNDCSDSIELFQGSRFLDAYITSYSGEYWTKSLKVNSNLMYNLSVYSNLYSSLGDPFKVEIPITYLSDGTNDFDIELGTDGFNTTSSCSSNNTVVYTIAINLSTERSDALPLADGCEWIVESEDGTLLNLTIPVSYTGINTCNYTSTNIIYDPQDAYQFGAFTIFSKLDFRNTGKLIVNLNDEDLEVIVSTISGVPYMWGPAKVRVEVER